MITSLEKRDEILIITKDNKKYELYLPSHYELKNDTIFAVIKSSIQPRNKMLITENISVEDIKYISRKEFDTGGTILLFGFFVGIIFIISDIKIY